MIYCAFCLPLADADDVLFYYCNVIAYESIKRCQHRTVYTHVIAKFIRSMSHSVKCSDLVGLLKSCSVVWALYHLAGMTPQARFFNEAMLQSLVCFLHIYHMT